MYVAGHDRATLGAMRWQRAVAPAVGVVAVAAGVALALALQDGGLDCDGARTLPLRGDGSRLGPLALGAGEPGSFSVGYPHKVGVKAWPDGRKPLASAVVVSGARCADGARLRFSYGGPPLPAEPPYSVDGLRTALGTPQAVFEPFDPESVGGGAVGYSGYMLFWAPGKWRLEARQEGRLVGTLVLDLGEQAQPPAD
jgi:hypothetical protein